MNTDYNKKEGFHLYLMSSSSHNIYDNSLAHFTNKLPRELNLKDYVVSLVDIFLPPIKKKTARSRRALSSDDEEFFHSKRRRRDNESSNTAADAVQFSVDQSNFEIRLTKDSFKKIRYSLHDVNFGNGLLSKLHKFINRVDNAEIEITIEERATFLEYVKLDFLEALLTTDLSKLPLDSSVYKDGQYWVHIYQKSNVPNNITLEYKNYVTAKNFMLYIVRQLPLHKRNVDNLMNLINNDFHTILDIGRINKDELKAEFEKNKTKAEMIAWIKEKIRLEEIEKKREKEKQQETVQQKEKIITIHFNEYGASCVIDVEKMTSEERSKLYELDQFIDLIRRNLNFLGNPERGCEKYTRDELISLREKIRQNILSSVKLNDYNEKPEYETFEKDAYDLQLNLPYDFEDDVVLEREDDGTLKDPIESYKLEKRYKRKSTLIKPGDYRNFEFFMNFPIKQIEKQKRNKETFSDSLKVVFELFRKHDEDARLKRGDAESLIENEQNSGKHTEEKIDPEVQQYYDNPYKVLEKYGNNYYNYYNHLDEVHNESMKKHNAVKAKVLEHERWPKEIITSGSIATTGKLDYLESSHLIFVYANIVKPTIVGSQELKILKIWCEALDSDKGHIIQFTEGQYTALQSTTISSIEILILDGQGNKINFADADLKKGHIPTVLHLHFRSVSI